MDGRPNWSWKIGNHYYPFTKERLKSVEECSKTDPQNPNCLQMSNVPLLFTLSREEICFHKWVHTHRSIFKLKEQVSLSSSLNQNKEWKTFSSILDNLHQFRWFMYCFPRLNGLWLVISSQQGCGKQDLITDLSHCLEVPSAQWSVPQRAPFHFEA